MIVPIKFFKKLLLSVTGGISTLVLIVAIRNLPYSTTRDLITDVLSLPGGILASLFYPQGVHSNGGASGWAWWAFFGNLIFYMLVWFVLLSIYFSRKSRK